jgi:hypothetical protein
MIDASQSLTTRVESLTAGAHVIHAGFLNEEPLLALADGRILIGEQTLTPHGENAILVAMSDAARLITGGDDGKIFSITSSHGAEHIGDEKGRWIDAIALGPSQSVAWSTG